MTSECQKCDNRPNEQPREYRDFQIFQSIAGLGGLANLEFGKNLSCPLLCQNTIDSQEHLLSCPGIKKHLSIKQLEVLNNVRCEHIFGDPVEQVGAAKAFQLVLKVRDRLLDVNRRPAYHGNSSGPNY